jgi:hypothetical protein
MTFDADIDTTARLVCHQTSLMAVIHAAPRWHMV